MGIPFTVEQFYAVFRAYNVAVWPVQWLLVAAAVAGVVLVIVPRRWSHAAVSAILAALWAWLAVAYHFAFFARINPLAYAFCALSLVGAGVFAWQGLVRRRLRFQCSGSVRSWVGAAMVGFALVAYPAWSWRAGHAWPDMPTFGLPCPTTLYTIGMLAFLRPPYPRTPHVVPMVWSAIGAQAAFFLGVPQDLSLIVAGLVGVFLVLRSGRIESRGAVTMDRSD